MPNILFFGDSLTAGFLAGGDESKFRPPSRRVAARIRKRDGGGDGDSKGKKRRRKTEIQNEGEPGDTVQDAVRTGRLERVLASARRRFTHVVILMATNDLRLGGETEAVVAGLGALYEACFAHGAAVLALTVPEIGFETPGLTERRTAVNEAIAALAASDERRRCICVDVASAMPQASLPEEERKKLWGDSVHCTIKGYSQMGDLIFDALEASGV